MQLIFERLKLFFNTNGNKYTTSFSVLFALFYVFITSMACFGFMTIFQHEVVFVVIRYILHVYICFVFSPS